MKVVIPAAGQGVRFFPATKSQPKEMLPVLDRPVIQYVVEDAVASGADDILIITGRSKRAIEDHFDVSPELQKWGQLPELQSLDELSKRVSLHYIRQREPRGLADAVGIARRHVGTEYFGVLLGDTINVCTPPLLHQLWAIAQLHRSSVIAVESVPVEKVRDYGIVTGREIEPGLYQCEELLEKPDPASTPSRLGITGAYVFSPDIFLAIDRTPPGRNGEVQLTDAIQLLTQEHTVLATTFRGTRYDIGDRFLWLRTNLEFAYRHPEYKGRLRDIMVSLMRDDTVPQ
ncbi:MAG: UTP--glucose-1-phosphate uridylyltransferase [Thermoplasmata archaeon]|nr:UTP--glucose-1-phosphate uridylyltransferase [Thermoplasmata archaeon]